MKDSYLTLSLVLCLLFLGDLSLLADFFEKFHLFWCELQADRIFLDFNRTPYKQNLRLKIRKEIN